jgi:transposase
MYSDTEQWLRIRHRILVEGISRKRVVRETGISMNTVRKMLAHPQPVPYGPRQRAYPRLGPYMDKIQQMLRNGEASYRVSQLSRREIFEHIRQQGFSGSYGTVRNYIGARMHRDRRVWEAAYDHIRSLDRRSAVRFLMHLAHKACSRKAQRTLGRHSATGNLAPCDGLEPHQKELINQAAFTWMRKVLQKQISGTALRHELGDIPDFDALLESLYEGHLSERNRALAVLASIRGWHAQAVCTFLGIDRKSYRKYVQAFGQGGTAALFERRIAANRKLDSEALKTLIFSVLHEPPHNYGINRTAWTMATLSRVLSEKGQPACRDTIRKITHQAGWRWRKARVVLTSSDPDYSEKLDRVRSILSNLQPDEAFFSIDEFGPFAVKMRGGRALTAPGEHRVVPQWQKSRGSLIITAALELSKNQITHFYSEKKNTAEMIRMIETLLETYPTHQRLYLSWDAASWHTSKRLHEWIAEHNASAHCGGRPIVTTAPLPSGAQFLNVIEAVFSGMARAIVHNSNYSSLDDAKAAIDRYFAERNAQFRVHPKRAGEKIWGCERQPAAFSEANNCKDPYYR